MLGWLLLLAALGYGLARVFAGYPRLEGGWHVLNAREVTVLRAAAEATFPPGGAIPASGSEAEVARHTDRWMAVLHPRVRVLVRLLLLLVEQATLVFPAPGPRGWRRFSTLSTEQRALVLERWRTSRLYPRRIVFASLRAILTMGYMAYPPVMRQLGVAPLAIPSPVCEADLLYPPIGAPLSAIRHTRASLTPESDGRPLPLDGPLHPDYRGEAVGTGDPEIA